MRFRPAILALLLGLLVPAVALADAELSKVLPHFLDRDGHHSLSPSLFERDAYQKWLREHPEEQSGIRYDVRWRSEQAGTYVVKIELRGDFEEKKPKTLTIAEEIERKGGGAEWTGLTLEGEEFTEFGPIVAWRVTVSRDDVVLDEQTSFLW